MDSTSKSPTKAKGIEEKSLAKAKNSRGMSAKACAAKAMTWKLEMVNVVPNYEASISVASLP